MEQCLFCQFVQETVPHFRVWEDDAHIAFLTIFPNTPGFTVIATKQHYPSYAFAVPEEVAVGLFRAARSVAQLLDRAFPQAGRCGLMMEGTGIDHLHLKLSPLHGYASGAVDLCEYYEFFERYPGYISSHDGPRMSDEALAALAQHIRG